MTGGAKVFAFVGAAFLVLALAIVVVPVSTSGMYCGSAFSESRESEFETLDGNLVDTDTERSAADDCDAFRSFLSYVALVSVLSAAVAFFVSTVLMSRVGDGVRYRIR